MAGVTPQSFGLGLARQASTWLRISLMIGIGLNSCSAVDSPSASGRASPFCCAFLAVFFARGTGVISLDWRRPAAGS